MKVLTENEDLAKILICADNEITVICPTEPVSDISIGVERKPRRSKAERKRERNTRWSKP